MLRARSTWTVGRVLKTVGTISVALLLLYLVVALVGPDSRTLWHRARYIPWGYADPYAAQSPPFVFGPCPADDEVIEIQLKMIKDERVTCDKRTGHCRCPKGQDLIFDGEKCIKATAWEDSIKVWVSVFCNAPFS